MPFQLENLLNVLITVSAVIFVIIRILGFGKARQKRQSAEPPRRMPSFGGEGPGGWAEREMERRSASGKQPGAGASSNGSGLSAARTEAKPPEVHYEGYERAADWEARKQMYAEQDRAKQEAERRKSDEERARLDQLRQGIIWSEILGAPRAKRPYGK